jgi:eukaryotic-like serine/threonine-protein kinase
LAQSATWRPNRFADRPSITADIFAFGAVLYEMLTGERAFSGDSPIETMSAILNADPLEQPAATVAISGPLEPLLRHCLEKQPDERFQSARDLAFQLQAIASGSLSTSSAERAVGASRGGARRFILPTAVVTALVIGLAIGYWFPRGSGEESITLAVPMPQDVRVSPDVSPARAGGIAVSRDGRHIAFVGETAAMLRQIYVRSLDSPIIRAVPGTEGARSPSWSPDGRRLAFNQAHKLKTVALDAGRRRSSPTCSIRAARRRGATMTRCCTTRTSTGRSYACRPGGGTPSVVLPALGLNLS